MIMNKIYDHLKILVLLIAGTGMAVSQSFFYQNHGNDVWGASARSQAMGATSTVNDCTAGMLLFNPAGLSAGTQWLKISLNTHGNSVLERRGFRMFDTFGDFLTYGDYVSTRHQTSDFQLGAVLSATISDITFGGAVAAGTLLNFDYEYREEVRGRENFDDGIIGIRDPLVGYHTWESSGHLDMTSLGLSARMGVQEHQYLSLGAAFNMVHEEDVKTDLDVEQITDIPGYLSTVNPNWFINELDSGTFTSISAEWGGLMGLRAVLAYESELSLDRSERLFEYNPDTEEYEEIILEVFAPVSYSDFVRPARVRLAVNYVPREQTPMNLSFEFENVEETDNTEEIHSWKFGFEYLALRTVPVRAGVIYRDTPSKWMDPESIFTFGTGKQFSGLMVDVAGSYRLNTYYYGDLFLVDGDVRPEYDRIRETQFNYTVSLSYRI